MRLADSPCLLSSCASIDAAHSSSGPAPATQRIAPALRRYRERSIRCGESPSAGAGLSDCRVDDVKLRKEASETNVKRMPLADYRVVYFATHGLVAGDIKGLAEPSLALTIPPEPSDLDDGLLTESEVAQLKLNADWVVLSACNTAAGDKPGAEALSGLARAFFYAGARALLVSHWSVASDAATAVNLFRGNGIPRRHWCRARCSRPRSKNRQSSFSRDNASKVDYGNRPKDRCSQDNTQN